MTNSFTSAPSTSTPRRVAIIGAGNLGSALARGWAASGHSVTLAVRDPMATEPVKGGVPDGARVATVADALRDAEVVVLAMPSRAIDDLLPTLAGALDGRVVIDATNPVGPGLQLMPGPDGASQAERIQQLLPAALVVKCFNQTGANNIPAPTHPVRPVMFVAGNDATACSTVAALAADLGFESVQAGVLSRARDLEHLAMLWIALSALPASGLGRQFTFALQRTGNA